MTKQELSKLSQHAAIILLTGLIDDLRLMIGRARESVASAVNSTLPMLY
jgi:hypothetical protein